jgi:septal ring factor EnvC (AmiA/AmiB activator)
MGIRNLIRWTIAYCRLPIALATLLIPATLPAQSDIEASRRRLEDIRAERDRLRREQDRLEGQVRDAGAELKNIERQRDATNRIVNELERQLRSLGDQLLSSSQQLALAQDNLADRRAVLHRRLVEIYKRGPLYSFQVLLTAESFSNLLSRYKYLYLQNRQDRSLVSDISALEGRIRRQRGELVNVREDIDRRREERSTELRSFQSLAEDRAAQLSRLSRSRESAKQRVSALERDEQRLLDVLASLERNRPVYPSANRTERRRAHDRRPRLARVAGRGENPVSVRARHPEERGSDPAKRDWHRRAVGHAR